MRSLVKISSLIILSTLIGPLAAAVKLTLEQPDRFIDLKYPETTTEKAANALTAALIETAQDYLAEHHKGAELTITVTDIDRAGDVDYGVSMTHHQLRILKDSIFTRLEFNYQWVAKPGAQPITGEVNVKKIFTPTASQMRKANRDGFYYERALLLEWLEGLARP